MNDLFRLEVADVLLKLSSASRDDVLAEFASVVAERYPAVEERELLQLLQDRESLGSTGIGDGIAIPHCTSPALKAPVILFGRSDTGIDFCAADNKPVSLLFLMVTPEGDAAIHLKLLSRISRILKSAGIRRRLLEAESEGEIVTILTDQGSDRCQP